MGVAVTTRKFTVDEYHTMIQSGILHEDDRVELLVGKIVEISPIGKNHAACVDNLAELFIVSLAGKARIRIQNPLVLSDFSEPQPDIMILKYRKDAYGNKLPRPDDVFLLVEVGEMSVEKDRQMQLPLYARAGIREVWLIDLVNEVVERYLEPAKEQYRRIERFEIGDEISPQAFPEFRLSVNDILRKSN